MIDIIITDPALLKQLTEATGPILFRDPDGNVVCQTAGRWGVPPSDLTSPIHMDELERRRQATKGGRPLADILRDLREKHGE